MQGAHRLVKSHQYGSSPAQDALAVLSFSESGDGIAADPKNATLQDAE
jgi:hypothetical protein